jgi:hypothetical protein
MCDDWRTSLALATSTQAAETGEGMMEWISVHDALPEPGETVLAWCVDSFHAGCNLARYAHRGQYGQERFWVGLSFIADSNGCAISDIPVSHWRRLPDPPEREPST